MTICDEIRDDILPYHGIRLEDKTPGEPSVWKYADKEELLRERDRKIEEKLKKDAVKKQKEEE